MRAVNIADLKNNLSRYLDEVRQGEEVLIKDRNKPLAKIVPLSPADDAAEMMRLAAEGKIRLPEKDRGISESFWKLPLPKASVNVSLLIREERDER
jgi:prevent-host-death family protein